MTQHNPRRPDHAPGGARHHTRALSTGTVVHVWAPGQPAAAMIQLQHGFAEYSERFVHQYSQLVPRLTGKGVEVWAMDLPGHGRSPGRPGVVDVRRAAEEHARLRHDMLSRKLPLLAIGHSLGGLVTAGSIATDQTGIAGAVLLAPALPRSLPAPARTLLNTVARIFPSAPAPVPAAPATDLTRREEMVRQAAQDPLMAHRGLPLLVAASSLSVAAEVWASAPQWQVPCLVVHGTADTSTDPKGSRRLVELLKEGSTFLPVKGGRHELLHDNDAEYVLHQVLDFVDRCLGT
ncbi:alpha/beta fold hydrolase [Streptomyces sp. NPDC048243]|uniref:alpha/beta fold hydrolase n=1 Tax=Streptomyces sp. NPDC048243 TaxID=3365522 RepID=UPI0037200249